MKIKREFVLRQILEDYYLVPVGDTVRTHSGLFVLTQVAARVWELLPECDTEDQIVDRLMAEFDTEDVTREQIAQDVSEFLESIRKLDILE